MIARVRPTDARGGLDYLGPEFLTWLWWRADVDPCFVHPVPAQPLPTRPGGATSGGEGDSGKPAGREAPESTAEVFVHVDEHLEFRGERAASRRTVLRSGAPGASMDARAAMRSGKVLVAARLLLARGEDEFRFTLRAEDLDVSGLRLPGIEGAPRERLEGGIEKLEQFFEDLDLCFATFLAVRTGPEWEAEVARIRTWRDEASPDETASVTRSYESTDS